MSKATIKKALKRKRRTVHLLSVPFTGLGLYGGFRGNRWLKNRIKIFKQFVVPSLQAQIKQDFVLWCAWRYKENGNPLVGELKEYLDELKIPNVFTYSGIMFYDDKYPDEEARQRLVEAIHGASAELINIIGDAETILMTIQPSDDLYNRNAVAGIQGMFEKSDLQAFGFERGYIMDYKSGKLAEWNPKTNPPFYTIKFSREDFIDPFKHITYTGLKEDVGQYKKGTPIPSHEYVGKALNYGTIKERGFLVGTHLDNISTTFKHPYTGKIFDEHETKIILKEFGINQFSPLKIGWSLKKWILSKLPHTARKKLRYWWGEKIYNFLRS